MDDAPYRWSPATGITKLRTVTAPFAFSYFTAVNDVGTAAGYMRKSNQKNVAVIWASDGSVTELPLPANRTSSEAHGINNAGQIVGYTR